MVSRHYVPRGQFAQACRWPAALRRWTPRDPAGTHIFPALGFLFMLLARIPMSAEDRSAPSVPARPRRSPEVEKTVGPLILQQNDRP
jgi:hypothetical protein